MLTDLKNNLKALENPTKAKNLQRYFKTGKGEYGEGDIFLGLTVPETRKIAGAYKDLPLKDIKQLLASPIHEHRQVALMILGLQFQKASEINKKLFVEFYLSQTKAINNWDLVDGSAGRILGEYLFSLNSVKATNKILKNLAKSKNIWERRIAIIATFAFIKCKNPKPSLMIAEILLYDTHDLIQKAVGWTLREVGKNCSQEVEEEFLKKYYKTMPRTTLRYAIERFTKEHQQSYLHGKI